MTGALIGGAGTGEEFLRPGGSVEWRDGTSGGIRSGTLVEPDDGIGGPWWLVDVDGEEEQSYVKTHVLYPKGGIRRERVADAIHGVMRQHARACGTPGFPAWSHALACADAALAELATAEEVSGT